MSRERQLPPDLAVAYAFEMATRNHDAAELGAFADWTTDARWRAAIAREFGDLRSLSEADRLRAWAVDPSDAVRRAAIIALAKLSDPRNTETFANVLSSDPDEAARVWAVTGLGMLEPSPRTRGALAKGLSDPKGPVARASARRLALDPTQDAAALLTQALSAPRPSVRWVARQALARYPIDVRERVLQAAGFPKSEAALVKAAGMLPMPAPGVVTPRAG